ncbi:ATP-binding protein [Plastorhodobacter daqingensis]|uniref:histidine kinase n=1 Tax=Plastorhodobacter daqingensis TaxID=1387281 RepID=A0ABW2ULE9_9RHOB
MNSGLVRAILAGIPLPVLLIGEDARIVSANAGAEALFGSAIVDRHHVIVLRQPALLDCIEGTFRHRQPSTARYVVVGPSRETTYRVQASPLEGGGVLVVFEDITDMETAGQMRRDFVANVSHELRTPLTALIGFIETLKGAARDDAAARARFLDIMEREAMRMNRLVADLLSLSRVEAAERVRPTETVDVTALVKAAIAALRPIAADQGATLEFRGEDTPIEILADPDQITQVMHNLIENALKYGAPGEKVTIAITREARDVSLRGPAVRIDVIDRGDGIDPIHIPRLTERFYRIDDHRSREKGGTGLGLAIVKHIVNRHRGRFRIESERGVGSRFSISLPER